MDANLPLQVHNFHCTDRLPAICQMRLTYSVQTLQVSGKEMSAFNLFCPLQLVGVEASERVKDEAKREGKVSDEF